MFCVNCYLNKNEIGREKCKDINMFKVKFQEKFEEEEDT